MHFSNIIIKNNQKSAANNNLVALFYLQKSAIIKIRVPLEIQLMGNVETIIKFKISNGMKQTDCIFCKIVNKEIPCHKIYEDEKFLAFLDIQPVSHGHVLIIPKEHIIWMQDANDEIISEIFILTKKIMLTMKGGMKCDYVQVGVNGEEIPHFHIHLIPRYFDDNFPQFPRKKYQEGEPDELIKRITSAF